MDFDEDLYRALRHDGRAAHSTLAARLGVDRSLISQRLHHLRQTGQLKIVAVIHPRLLGLSVQAHLMLSIQGPTDCVFEELRRTDSVAYLSETTGPTQAVAEVWARSTHDLGVSLNRIRTVGGVSSMHVTYYDQVLRTLMLGEEPETTDIGFDDLDLAIIQNLQRDGRMTFGEMQRRTGAAASTCRKRMQRLVTLRVVQIGGIRGRGAGDKGLLFGVGVDCAGDSATAEAVEKSLTSLPGLEFTARTMGRFTHVATIGVRSLEEYNDVVRDLRGIPGVRSAETWIHAAVWAERYDWSLERLDPRKKWKSE